MKSLLFSLLLVPFILHAQVKGVVYFKAKDSNAKVQLSAKSLAKRSARAIALEVSDYAVNTDYTQAITASGVNILYVSRWLNAAIVEQGNANSELNFDFIDHITWFAAEKKGSKKKEKSVLSAAKVQFSDRNVNLHKANELALAGYEGKGMHIAIFDAGFQGVDTLSAFKAIFTEKRVLNTFDIVGGGSNVFRYDDHGTMVLSTIAAQVPNQFKGTATAANYSLFVTEDVSQERRIEEFNWLRAAEMADSLGVDVINSSLGYTRFDESSEDYTQAQMNGQTTIVTFAATMAARKGILVVNSAGNEGGSAWGTISAPADADSILAVGAVRIDSIPAGFSSPGPSADGRSKPDVCSLGQQSAVITNNGSLILGNGTSFASPIFAGIATSLWQVNPALSNIELRQLILESANQYNLPNAKCGYGIPNMQIALENVKATLPRLLSEVLVYPNPSTGAFYLNLSEQTLPVKLRIFDVLGHKIAEANVESKEVNGRVDVSTLIQQVLVPGTYYLKVNDDKGSINQKLIIN